MYCLPSEECESRGLGSLTEVIGGPIGATTAVRMQTSVDIGSKPRRSQERVGLGSQDFPVSLHKRSVRGIGINTRQPCMATAPEVGPDHHWSGFTNARDVVTARGKAASVMIDIPNCQRNWEAERGSNSLTQGKHTSIL
jgi:hypothetical protein